MNDCRPECVIFWP